MQKDTAACGIVQRPGAGDLLLGPGQVDFRRILCQNNQWLLRDPSTRLFDVRRENVVKANLFVVKETVGGRRFGIAAAGRWNARRGVSPQLREHFLQAAVQALVVQVHVFHFVPCPRR